MSGQASKMSCEKCGKNISMTGVLICLTCDPDWTKFGKPLQGPSLCDECMITHKYEHGKTTEDKHG